MIKPRVLVFSLAYHPFIGGAEVAIKEITDRLPEYEFEMLTVSLDGKQEKKEKISNILVHRFTRSKILSPFLGAWKIYQLDRAQPIDVFWCVQVTYTSGAAYIFNILRFWLPIPIVLTLQEGELLDKRPWGFVNLSWRLALPFTTRVVAISNYLATRARAFGYGGISEIIPNGVDLQKLSAKRYQLSATPTIITTGRLVKKNGVDTLIKSLQFLDPQIKLELLGGGTDESELKQLVKDLNLEDRVKFLGHVAPEQVANYLNQADIFCRPSRSEGLGNSFLEAMAAGLPTIGTPVGGIPDFLIDPSTDSGQGATGWLAEVDNPQSLAEKVKLILDPANQGEVERVVLNAQKLVREKYDWAKLAPQMSQLFSDLIAKKC